MGKLVIAVLEDFSEISAVIKEYECGYVIENGNYQELVKKILMLYNNPDLRNRFSENARKAIRSKYNLKNISSGYIKLLERLEEIK